MKQCSNLRWTVEGVLLWWRYLLLLIFGDGEKRTGNDNENWMRDDYPWGPSSPRR